LEHVATGAACAESEAALRDALERHPTAGALREAIGRGEYDFYTKAPKQDSEMLLPKKGATAEETRTRLEHVRELLQGIAEERWNAGAVREAVWEYAEREGKGLVLWPLRVALSGKERSPDPFTIAEAVGKEEALRRIASAVETLK
jgi:Glutamyl- and glutaminyl-tRNA synthetases